MTIREVLSKGFWILPPCNWYKIFLHTVR